MQDSPFIQIGGELTVRALVDRFYDLMDEDPECAPIRAMHEDMARARDKLFLFLVGWLGGPPLYVQRYGHPRLRARHLPFPIDSSHARQWMKCMRAALAEEIEDEGVRTHLEGSFGRLALHMRNRRDPEPAGA